ALVPRRLESHLGGVAKWRALDIAVDLRLIVLGLLRQRHEPPLNLAHTLFLHNPCAAIAIHDHPAHVVPRKPALALTVCPGLAVIPHRADARAKPHGPIRAGRGTRDVVVGKPLGPRKESPPVRRAAPHTGQRTEPKPARTV